MLQELEFVLFEIRHIPFLPFYFLIIMNFKLYLCIYLLIIIILIFSEKRENCFHYSSGRQTFIFIKLFLKKRVVQKIFWTTGSKVVRKQRQDGMFKRVLRMVVFCFSFMIWRSKQTLEDLCLWLCCHTISKNQVGLN